MTDRLASQGGTPVRATFLPYALPQMGEEEMREVAAVLESGWITTGPKVQLFEEALRKLTGAKHAVCVDSGTAALHLSLVALHLEPGDEVITTPLTFCSTVNSILHAGGVPVLADVDAQTLNLSVEAVERAVTERTRALLPVHYGGLPCDMKEFGALARDRNLAVIEDAAHAVGAFYDGTPIGTLSDATCLSFYANKNITTAEGGALLTDRDDWAQEARLNSLHGMSRDAWMRYTQEGSWYYEVVTPGFKYNMTDVEAALGIHQVNRLGEFTARRRHLDRRYREGLADCDFLEFLEEGQNRESAHHLFVIQLRLDALTIDRARFIEELKAEGIGATVNFIPIHYHPYYRDTLNLEPGALPVAEAAYPRLITLPLYPKMQDSDADDVIEAVRKVGAACRR